MSRKHLEAALSALEFCGASVALKSRAMCHLAQALSLSGENQQAQSLAVKARKNIEAAGLAHPDNLVDSDCYEYLVDIQNRL